MPTSLTNIRIDVHDKIYLKDPYSSDLGRSIIERSLDVMDELGLEKFTFKKVAADIGTTESAVYRYFENKHKILLYYASWYWGWLEYRLAFGTANMDDAGARLERAIKIILEKPGELSSAPFDLNKLERVIISESSKAFFTKQVDGENKVGVFAQFKSLCARFSALIDDAAPDYPYSRTLASTFIESQLNQLFFCEHLPSISDLQLDTERYIFYKTMIFNTIEGWESK